MQTQKSIDYYYYYFNCAFKKRNWKRAVQKMLTVKVISGNIT